jgi:DNA modification methylase
MKGINMDDRNQQAYVEDTEEGEMWTAMLGDSCVRLAELADGSVDLSVYSPPFASLFTYSPSDRDLGNCRDSGEFFEHYRFIIEEVLRVTKPGRLSVVHCQQLATQKVRDGAIGLYDFRGDIIRAHVEAGWVFHGEVTIDKDPQAQAIRTKATTLMFQTLNKDSSMSRPALADYLLMFRKRGDNETQIKPECDNETWIEWARPVWIGIRETNTLNTWVARDEADERHICPLQLDLIERVVRLWSNRGETVLSPFLGIGSEIYTAVKWGRRGVGCELKPSYWRTAVANLRQLDEEMALPTLFGAPDEVV